MSKPLIQLDDVRYEATVLCSKEVLLEYPLDGTQLFLSDKRLTDEYISGLSQLLVVLLRDTIKLTSSSDLGGVGRGKALRLSF